MAGKSSISLLTYSQKSLEPLGVSSSLASLSFLTTTPRLSGHNPSVPIFSSPTFQRQTFPLFFWLYDTADSIGFPSITPTGQAISVLVCLLSEVVADGWFNWSERSCVRGLSSVTIAKSLQDKKAKYILYQHVCSSIKPNIAQDEADSIAFYQVYNKKNRDKFKIPKFLEHIVDSNKTPVVTLRTGYKAFQVGMQGRQFTSYWEIFVKTHELELGDTLVFIPESINSFTVQIYKPNGVEKLFPWYHKYYVYSYL
ncbi:uncharacterized protein [Coffea arabica]|uniref:TF-B3 domain-containing protein n=1 Tax=Coffea arabica TaxID=13443 RepID=A0ABM4VHM4_COFAR